MIEPICAHLLPSLMPRLPCHMHISSQLQLRHMSSFADTEHNSLQCSHYHSALFLSKTTLAVICWVQLEQRWLQLQLWQPRKLLSVCNSFIILPSCGQRPYQWLHSAAQASSSTTSPSWPCLTGGQYTGSSVCSHINTPLMVASQSCQTDCYKSHMYACTDEHRQYVSYAKQSTYNCCLLL